MVTGKLLQAASVFEYGVDVSGNNSGFMGSPASKRKMVHDCKVIKEIRGTRANLSSQLASGHTCQIKPLSQPLSLLKGGKLRCWGFLFCFLLLLLVFLGRT